MTNLLESLQQQFASTTADITSKIIKLRKGEGDRAILIEQLKTTFDEGKETLEQIDLEIRSFPVDERRIHQKHLDGFNEELKRLQNDFKNAKLDASGMDESRIELLDGDLDEDDVKLKLLSESERKESSRRKLETGGLLRAEDDGVEGHVLTGLSIQRDSVVRPRERVRRSNYEFGRSSRITHMILRKAMQNKLVLYTIGIIFTLMFSLIVYRSFVSA